MIPWQPGTALVLAGRIEPLLRDIRNSMAGAGLTVESAKGECNLGQHEIAFRYADAVRGLPVAGAATAGHRERLRGVRDAAGARVA